MTRTPWFGPKRHLGWGWAPCSWQGWLATAVFLGALVPLAVLPRRPWLVAVLVVAYGVVIVATGDPPGGPR